MIFLLKKQDLTFHAIGDNLHEISKPVVWEKRMEGHCLLLLHLLEKTFLV